MGTYTSKYTGEQIDELLGQVENGGGTATSSYKEAELLTEYADYKLGGTSGTTIGQDLILNDDVSNYDEIVFYISYLYNATNMSHPKENNIHVSNIVYNNTDTQKLDGSRFTINTVADETTGMGIWFKDGKTLRIHITFATFSPASDAKLRLMSIKGIKY